MAEEKKEGRTYMAIDLKSFYASVECVARKIDPLGWHLVVADPSRTNKTICLAVSPSLKAYGISGRARLYEVEQAVAQINAKRLQNAPGRRFTGSSCEAAALAADPSLALDYIVAPPRMAEYIRCSTQVMGVYLRYVAPEDIFAYSVDEVFMDVTAYLSRYGHSAREMARVILRDVLATTGVTATVGIGTNMYLCKIAMDIVAKHAAPDEFGARIAELDERSYREQLWGHRPLTDFWRVGRGYASRLERCGLYTMGDIARCSLGGPGEARSEEMLYRMFGVNAGLLIDHAWGWEPCTIQDVKGYRPENRSRTSGQVLSNACSAATGRLILREMADGLSMDLVREGVTADRVTITIGYDAENIADPARRAAYRGKVTIDWYGRPVPKHTGGTAALPERTSSTRAIADAAVALFDRTTDPSLLIRRLNVTAEGLRPEGEEDADAGQMDLFDPAEDPAGRRKAAARARERQQQEAVLRIRDKYGKNALIKGMNLLEGATAMERNRQIGGHRA